MRTGIAGADGGLCRVAQRCRPRRANFPTASRAAISAAAPAIAVSHRWRSVRRPPPGGMRIARRIPISMPGRKCRPIAAASPEGDSDAHSGFGNFRDRSALGGGTGAGTDLRSRLSGLPACLRQDHLLRMQLYLAAPMQHVGLGPLGAMRGQSVSTRTHPRNHRRGATSAIAAATRNARYSSSTTWPSTSDTRRSIRPASSMLWVAISIATCVAFTSCISALKT